MEEEKENVKGKSIMTWFRRWFLNNKFVTMLLITLLILLNVLVFSRVAYLLNPVAQFLGVVGLPIVLSGIMFYLLNPIIDWLERKKIPRVVSITWVFIVVFGLAIWGITTLIPIIREQILSFIENWPDYWLNMIEIFDSLTRSTVFSQFQVQLAEFNQNILSAISEQANGMIDSAVSSIGSLVGTLTSIVIALVTMPFILFYLLKDGKELPYHIMNVVPTKMRYKTYHLLTEMNMQISYYIRGQLTVAFFVALMFWIGFDVIDLDYAITLGVLAGFLNLIPYLGSFLATIPALIVALVDSPTMLVKVLIVFMLEQLIEGRLLSPLILGNSLKIHPVTIILVLLSAGRLFGVTGVILGIPGYAVMKIILEHAFAWYKNYTGIYEGNYNPAPAPKMVRQKRKRKLPSWNKGKK